ncbi:ABC transporter substrate-binding protein [Rhodopseudomonas palustris]|jgi:NitT/TauT family transport system substrate-binding protein|uniref:ABC transporter substrate-binding protein n=1 Tax=Rhodopseudomonas palustris TaxID=1076 RepID=UPI0020CDED4A|nr:ABC transporter substrate-binding protein [Rhodopseudomonas palustris]MCP9627037.1 ABC transporter substrate-binding protein [Rhodopseudomonas palustris]
MSNHTGHRLSRRSLLLGAGAGALIAPLGVQAFPGRPAPFDFENAPLCRTAGEATPLTGAPRKLKLSWNANAVCSVQVPVAVDYDFFKKQNLDVELVNFSGSTDQLLEAIATGKSDAGVGMALRWLKPLEQGFDVKIVAGTHGGCLRAIAPTKSDITKVTDLKGKVVAIDDQAGPSKNFFAIQLAKAGVDPNKDVDWRQYPGNLVRLAVEKGEAQAALSSDPLAYAFLKDGEFREIGSNLDGIYRNVSCCIVGLRGSLLRDDPQVARALTQALLDAAEFSSRNPDKAAKSFLPYAPKLVTEDDLRELIKYHTHDHHPTGAHLKQELKLYADDLKVVSVIKPSTDTTKFADKIYADVFKV